MKKRVVVIGLGDAGLLTAMRLPTAYEVVAISSKPCFVSGQELGNRLAHVDEWKNLNRRNYDRFKGLDHVRVIHGIVTAVDLKKQEVTIDDIDHHQHIESYDALLIATGTTNGFWRNDKLETYQQVESQLSSQAEIFQKAQTIAIVGGGPTAVDSASNLKEVYPTKSIHVFFSQAKVLSGYPERTRDDVQRILTEQGVQLHSNHRAKTDGVDICAIGEGDIHWQTGQQPFSANKILWAVGAVQPNNQCLPKELLNEDGFVEVTPQLYHPTFFNIFAVGDIAASDPNRSSAKNMGFDIAAKNIDNYLRGKHHKFKSFHAPQYRWGSILGVQEKGMRLYSQSGKAFVVRRWWVKEVIVPHIIHKVIFKGIRSSSAKKI
jgi:NADH dehydrogenase FAD-containing subunit